MYITTSTLKSYLSPTATRTSFLFFFVVTMSASQVLFNDDIIQCILFCAGADKEGSQVADFLDPAYPAQRSYRPTMSRFGSDQVLPLSSNIQVPCMSRFGFILWTKHPRYYRIIRCFVNRISSEKRV